MKTGKSTHAKTDKVIPAAVCPGSFWLPYQHLIGLPSFIFPK